MQWLHKLFSARPVSQVAPAQVEFDDQRVALKQSDGTTQSVRWDDLIEVAIITTDAGPMLDDVFWALSGTSGHCTISNRSEGMSDLMVRLQSLPGFEDWLVFLAMSTTEDGRFVCWSKATRTTENEAAARLD